MTTEEEPKRRASIGVETKSGVDHHIRFRGITRNVVLREHHSYGEGPLLEGIPKHRAGKESRVDSIPGSLWDGRSAGRGGADEIEITIPDIERIGSRGVPGSQPILELDRGRSKAEFDHDLRTLRPLAWFKAKAICIRA